MHFFFQTVASLNVRNKRDGCVSFAKPSKVVPSVSHRGCLSRTFGTKKSNSSMSHPADARCLLIFSSVPNIVIRARRLVEPDMCFIKKTYNYTLWQHISLQQDKNWRKFKMKIQRYGKNSPAKKQWHPKETKNEKKHFSKILQIFAQKYSRDFPFQRRCK